MQGIYWACGNGVNNLRISCSYLLLKGPNCRFCRHECVHTDNSLTAESERSFKSCPPEKKSRINNFGDIGNVESLNQHK